MNISLTPELEQFIDGKIESGGYNNASEVIREGLRLLKESDEIRQRIRESIERGAADVLAGRVIDGPEHMKKAIGRIKNRAKKRA